MASFDPRGLRAILRRDLNSFIAKSFQTVAPAQAFLPNWHIEAIAWNLQQCLDRKIRRLIITVPPRYLKSVCASVAFPAYILGHDPRAGIVNVSYSGDVARKIARDCRAVMTSRWYRESYPGTRLSRERNAEHDFIRAPSSG